MDKYQIGTNAGIVWNKLKDNAHWDYKHDTLFLNVNVYIG